MDTSQKALCKINQTHICCLRICQPFCWLSYHYTTYFGSAKDLPMTTDDLAHCHQFFPSKAFQECHHVHWPCTKVFFQNDQHETIKLPKSRKKLVGGFNPFEKYYPKWESSLNRDENYKYLKPPPRKNPSFPTTSPKLYMLHRETLSAAQHDRIVPKGRPWKFWKKCALLVEPCWRNFCGKFVGKSGEFFNQPLGVNKIPIIGCCFLTKEMTILHMCRLHTLTLSPLGGSLSKWLTTMVSNSLAGVIPFQIVIHGL